MSRHMACKVCRDRKVRCDGNQPSCDKCTRSGDDCVYAPPSLPSRGELAQTIESLQERLVKAEAQILEQQNSCRSSQQYTGLPSPYSTASMVNSNPPIDLQMPFPTASQRTSVFLPNGDFRSPGQAYGDFDDTGDFFSSLNSTRAPTRAPTQPPEEFPLLPPACPLPSLNELRAMNNHIDGMDLSTGCDMSYGMENGDSALIATSLIDLVSSFFSIQADITGLSSAVAEYLAWVRKSPAKADNTTVLEILETRVRELNQIASTRHWAAFKHMHASFGTGDSYHALLRKVETDLMEKSIKSMHFFHDRYDITTTLAEQRHD
ncbi:hypothetical protein M426DRAFT_324024 [Hypoxylon sp. CI-4A]|nr:hypothetical protein M426DRAFT_324024 [Hypoxylon sp. CI-4A]